MEVKYIYIVPPYCEVTSQYGGPTLYIYIYMEETSQYGGEVQYRVDLYIRILFTLFFPSCKVALMR